MNITLPKPGRYVVAVSGGVDSVVLLNMLSNEKELKLVVAHFDHGIRSDSAEDRVLVQQLAEQHKLPFVYEAQQLGPKTSEATAREKRYNFLRRVMEEHQATGIITAHHQDDVLETAIINLLRGTGRKGLTALDSHSDLHRPLLKVPKADLIAYAKDQGLVWREDSTNQDTDYLRNYVRHQLVPKFSDEDRSNLLGIVEDLRDTNTMIDQQLQDQLAVYFQAGEIDRLWFSQLSHDVAREMMASWLRASGVRDFDKQGLERLVVVAKTGKPGSSFDVLHNVILMTGRDSLALVSNDR